jgi:hypothetical protein
LPTNPQNAGGIHDYGSGGPGAAYGGNPAPKKKNISLNDGYVRLFGGDASETQINNAAGPTDV